MTFTYKTPSLIIENISQKDIRVFDKLTIKKGQRVDIFQQKMPITESEITEALRAPDGDLYREINVKGTLVLHHIDTYSFDASAPTSSGSSSADISSYFTDKGQLLSFDGSDVVVIDPGADGYLLKADPTSDSGLSWYDPSAPVSNEDTFRAILASGQTLRLYVNSSTGSDSNSGTSIGSPLQTLNAAFEAIPDLQAGLAEIMLIGAGPYVVPGVLKSYRSTIKIRVVGDTITNAQSIDVSSATETFLDDNISCRMFSTPFTVSTTAAWVSSNYANLYTEGHNVNPDTSSSGNVDIMMLLIYDESLGSDYKIHAFLTEIRFELVETGKRFCENPINAQNISFVGCKINAQAQRFHLRDVSIEACYFVNTGSIAYISVESTEKVHPHLSTAYPDINFRAQISSLFRVLVNGDVNCHLHCNSDLYFKDGVSLVAGYFKRPINVGRSAYGTNSSSTSGIYTSSVFDDVDMYSTAVITAYRSSVVLGPASGFAVHATSSTGPTALINARGGSIVAFGSAVTGASRGLCVTLSDGSFAEGVGSLDSLGFDNAITPGSNQIKIGELASITFADVVTDGSVSDVTVGSTAQLCRAKSVG